MAKLKGVPVILIEKTSSGNDPFGAMISTKTEVVVENVLISPSSSTAIVDAQNLYGKKAVYTLSIPKDDTHNWEDAEVKFFNRTWKTFGIPLEGIEELIPLEWNKKVMVEAYE